MEDPLAFPLEIEGEVAVSGAARPLAEWLDRVTVALEHEGAKVRERDTDAVRFRGASWLSALALRTGELSFADSGRVSVTTGADGARIRYVLSTRRALVSASVFAVAVAVALAPVAGPVWAPFGGLVIWGWAFGWNWIAQRWRAASLFEELGSERG